MPRENVSNIVLKNANWEWVFWIMSKMFDERYLTKDYIV